ncbi:MAG: sigma-70 family RNA polymerase sigma factor [Pirellula sp.]
MDDITKILSAIQNGEPSASENLFAMLYDELKRIANQQMRHEAVSHTLQPTALVHEAYVRMLGSENCTWENRAHFFGAAAEAMRRILIESARSKGRKKRGGGAKRIEFDDVEQPDSPLADEVLDINDAVIALEAEDPELAELVKLRFFGGLMMDQIAELQGVSKSTIERRWTFAKAWLGRRLNAAQDS